MTKIFMTTILGSLLAMAPITQAGEVDVSFKDPQKFRDIRTSESTQKRFETKTLERLTEHFQGLASELPERQKLIIEITQLDLAGRVDPSYGPPGSRYRIVDRSDVPQIDFNYQLLDEGGDVLAADAVSLRDLALGQTVRRGNQRNDALFYEKAMISDWFWSESGLLAKNN